MTLREAKLEEGNWSIKECKGKIKKLKRLELKVEKYSKKIRVNAEWGKEFCKILRVNWNLANNENKETKNFLNLKDWRGRK